MEKCHPMKKDSKSYVPYWKLRFLLFLGIAMTAPRRLRMRLIGPQKMQLRLRSLMAGATERCRQCDLSFLTDSENVPMS